MAGVGNARIEIYNGAGGFVGFTTSAADGTWSYAVSTTGTYYARVVNSSVLSTRAGATPALIGVQTFRTNNGGAVTGEVGGRAPASADAPAGAAGTTLNTSTFELSGTTTGQAQTVTPITVANTTDRQGFDFGFNFDTIVNTNDVGQGSLRQFILNSNALGGTLNQQGLTANRETSIFQIPAARLSGGQMTIDLATPLPAITDSNTTLSGLTQTASTGETAPVDVSNNITASTGPEVVINAAGITGIDKGPGLLVLGQNTIVEALGVTGVGATTPAGTNAGSPAGVGILVRGGAAVRSIRAPTRPAASSATTRFITPQRGHPPRIRRDRRRPAKQCDARRDRRHRRRHRTRIRHFQQHFYRQPLDL